MQYKRVKLKLVQYNTIGVEVDDGITNDEIADAIDSSDEVRYAAINYLSPDDDELTVVAVRSEVPGWTRSVDYCLKRNADGEVSVVTDET